MRAPPKNTFISFLRTTLSPDKHMVIKPELMLSAAAVEAHFFAPPVTASPALPAIVSIISVSPAFTAASSRVPPRFSVSTNDRPVSNKVAAVFHCFSFKQIGSKPNAKANQRICRHSRKVKLLSAFRCIEYGAHDADARIDNSADYCSGDTYISVFIFMLYRIIVAVDKHVVAYHTLTRCCVLVRGYESAGVRVVVACLQVIQTGLGIVIIALVAERILCTNRVSTGVGDRTFTPCIISVCGCEFAGGSVCEGYYIALEVVDVIVEVVAAVGHTDTVALLVVEEAQCLAVGRLGENLRAVEQVLGRICAVTLAGSDAFRIVSKGNCFILYRFCKLPTLSCPTHHMK